LKVSGQKPILPFGIKVSDDGNVAVIARYGGGFALWVDVAAVRAEVHF